jgi:hypothetical protein
VSGYDIVGRDPIEKTIVESFIAAHPDEALRSLIGGPE